MGTVNDSPSGNGRSRRRAQGAWHLAEVAVAAAAVFAPLAIATIHAWAVATVAILSLLACALAVRAAIRSGEPFLTPAPAIALLAAALFVGLQVAPLPPSLLALLAPASHEVFEFALKPQGAWPAWRPLSLDPAATARELVKAISYLALFLAAVQVARSRRARLRLVTVLGAAALAVALIGFGHQLFGAGSLFGVFHYRQAIPPFLTTFGNPNHLASFLALGATALLARVLTERDRKVATLWALAYVATGVAVLLTLSRGGIVAFLVAQAMLGVAVFRARQSEREGVPVKARGLALPGALLLVLAVSAYLGWDALAEEWGASDSVEKLKGSKINLWPSFLPLVAAHWLAGVGRGAFEPAYQRFQEGFGLTVTHPENALFQWTAELGVPVGLFVLLVVGWSVLRALRQAGGDPVRLACIFGLLAIGLHELVDFGLELGGLAVPATVALAVAVARPEAGSAVGRRVALAWVPVAAALAAFGVWRASPSLEEDGERIAGMLGKASADEIAKAAAAAARRHPADYFPQLVAAQAFASERPLRPERVIAFAGRAMYLNRGIPEPHRLAARALRAVGRASQARLEYRLAYELGDRSALVELVRSTAAAAELFEGVPDESRPMLDLADELLRQGRVDDAEVVAKEAVSRHGESLAALRRLATVAARRGSHEEAARVGAKMSALDPSDPAGLEVRVEALKARQDWAGAARLLESEGAQRFPANPRVWLELADLRLGMGDTKAAREALRRLPPGIDGALRALALLTEAGTYDRDEQSVKAANLARQAVDLRPDDAGPRWMYATYLEKAGRFAMALEQAQQAVSRGPALRPNFEQMRERIERRRLDAQAAGRLGASAEELLGGGDEEKAEEP